MQVLSGWTHRQKPSCELLPPVQGRLVLEQCRLEWTLLVQAIHKEESKVSVSDRKILLVLAKPEDAQGHWPRLLKGTGKMPNVKVPEHLLSPLISEYHCFWPVSCFFEAGALQRAVHYRDCNFLSLSSLPRV